MNQKTGRRYKGTSPFADDPLDRQIFFGRDRERRSLLNLVLAEDLIVLFAKSGMGKTSLINAALLQPLREEGFFPMVVRVNDQEKGPLHSMFDGIRQAAQQSGVDCVNGNQASAWHFFKTIEFWSEENDLLRPVLILDQFEELFTLQLPDQQREFSTHLAALVRGRSALADLGLDDSQADHPADGDPPELKIVLSLREDFLAHLEDLASGIPGVLHNRFRLGPLSREGAHQAIIGPARLAHQAFQAEPFRYREQAVDEIVSFLGKKRLGQDTIQTNEVEPVQLQLICQYVEEQVLKRQALEGREVEVSELDLGGERRMQRILESFYDRTIDSIPSPSEARAVRRLCEKRLISVSGRRLIEDEEEIENNFKIPKTRLRQLVDARLLRAEPRLGGVFYELSHDTLVTPILESRKKRERRKWQIMVGSGLLALLAVVAGLAYAYSKVTDAQTELQAALGEYVFKDEDFSEIPAGEFKMGSKNGEPDEQPVRTVIITQGFQLNKYEVTQEQWLAVMDSNPSYFKGGKRPVESVSWDDVREFIRRMNQRNDGYEYRLPSEAEWEYAARAGTTGEYAGKLDEMAWYANNSGDSRIDATALLKKDRGNYSDTIRANNNRTYPVGEKEPNDWGLYDMHGNVWEWVQDWYDADYYGTRPNPDRDPRGPEKGSNRVIRGGGWCYPAGDCRSAYRCRGGPGGRNDALGFRLLRQSR